MKFKVLILIIMCIFLSGCYDYEELNNLAIIVGIAIDYKDDEFKVTMEALKNEKNGEKESENKSYIIKGSGKTLSKAYKSAFNEIAKEAYYSHLKIVIIEKDAAKNHLEEIVDYLVRDPNTRNTFYPLISVNGESGKILDNTYEENPIVSEAIFNMIENHTSKTSSIIKTNYENFLDNYLDEFTDAYLNTIDLKDNKIVIENLALFNKQNLSAIIPNDISMTTNLINNKSNNYYLNIPCDDSLGYLTISLYNNKKTNLNITDSSIEIKGDYNANIIEDACKTNFKDVSTYTNIENKFKNVLSENLISTVKELQNFKTDVIKIQDTYYQKNKKTLNNWTNLEVKTNINLNINKNGIIFEVKK